LLHYGLVFITLWVSYYTIGDYLISFSVGITLSVIITLSVSIEALDEMISAQQQIGPIAGKSRITTLSYRFEYSRRLNAGIPC